MTTTLTQAAERLAQGQTSATQLAEQALERAAQGEGPRVFTRVLREQALAEARASDVLRAAGLARSPLEGLPISVKDLFDIAGHSTLGGSKLLASATPATQTAEVVQRLRRAGAVIVGTTNMTEFAYSGLGLNPHYGTPRNPWQRDIDGGRIPGGSSSGAAISVTDGMALAAIGSDTGGSVRIPSALCGLTGFKPTARRVSMQGVLPLSANLDSIGPLAPSVRCCAALDAVLSGEVHGELRAASLLGLRLLAPTNVVLDGMDSTVAAAWQRALSLLSAAGAQITEAVVQPFSELAQINAKGGFTAAEAWAWHRHYIADRLAEYDPRVGTRILRGKDISAADYIELLARRQQWIAQVEAQMADHDLLVMPTVPVIAPKIAELQASDEAYFAANGLMLRNPTLINFLDGCAVSLPCHRAGEAPVGLSLAGTAGQDQRLLSVALAVETLLAQA
ncbi:MAG: amidase [Comamonas sp.]|jgi:aspartyl-tRNA(Asn)/glutamyl-tRNA(Gln) amidotransferase subunit A|uniref:amidase n=1 Tax=Comamonas sp. TaxID=34028 RepID=UPI00282B2547|nr:amidase [Comamonas sp.]MDR0214513.1 amidase [Comamonas sp.]